MIDIHVYFRTEIETVGRHWRDIVASLEDPLPLLRPVQNMNHALWLTGHMIWAEDYLLVEVPTGKATRRTEWDAWFDHTSEKMPGAVYPPWQEVRSEYQRVHENALKHLSHQTPASLARPSALNKQWFATASHSIAHQVTHGHYHLGQLVYLQKLLRDSAHEPR